MKKSRKEFIIEAHKNACSEWKQRIESEFPKLFKKETLEVGKWYKNKYKALFYISDYDGKKYNCYGFIDGVWDGKGHFTNQNDLSSDVLATEEEVKEALIKEAEKRGFKKGVKIRNHQGTFLLEDLDITYKNEYNIGIWTRQECGVWLIMNGKWAEIIENTISRADAEKQLKAKIID